MEEDLGPHIPETRTNLCSYAKRILKIETKILKNESPKALDLENEIPF